MEEIIQKFTELEEKIKALEEKINLFDQKICHEPTCWWVVTRKDNGYPVLVYEDYKRSQEITGETPVKVVPVTDDEPDENCWAIIVTDRYTRGTSLIYEDVHRAQEYVDHNYGKIIRVKKEKNV